MARWWKLRPGDMAFLNTKVGGNAVDYEGDVKGYRYGALTYREMTARERGVATGRIGELPTTKSQDVTMQWDPGYAVPIMAEMLHCSYDNATCY